MNINIDEISQQLKVLYGLDTPVCTTLNTLANYALEVKSLSGRFALKIYNPASRGADEIQWEINLTMHLIEKGAPVASPVAGKDNKFLQTFLIDDQDLTVVLFEWAAGAKPKPELSTYTLIGEAAAMIHNASDTFKSDLPREKYDAHELIDDQLERMRIPLEESGRWQRVYELSDRMRRIIMNPRLDYGIIHNDLTLDNVHLDNNSIIVFDLDSAAESWRAAEPWLMLRTSEDRFTAWLKGYRSVRGFSEEDESAVAAFRIVEDIRNVVWKLGFAKSSRGEPLMRSSDIPAVVDEWLEWERKYIQQPRM